MKTALRILLGWVVVCWWGFAICFLIWQNGKIITRLLGQLPPAERGVAYNTWVGNTIGWGVTGTLVLGLMSFFSVVLAHSAWTANAIDRAGTLLKRLTPKRTPKLSDLSKQAQRNPDRARQFMEER